MALVSFDDGKAHLNIDHNADDALIQQKIAEASEALLDYLKRPLDSWQDTGGTPVNVPFTIQAATKLILTNMYENRDGENADPLSQAVKDLVHRYRDPALA